MKKIHLFALVLVAAAAAVLAPASALAAQISAGESVSFVPKEGDAYVAGGQVSIEGPADADLSVVGGSVIVDGDVAGDLLAAGGNILLNGNVADDVRVAGGNLTISGDIGGDLLVFGGTVTLVTDATVAGDVIAFGGMLMLNGQIDGNLIGNAGAVVLRGDIGGRADLYTEQLTLAGAIRGDALLVASDVITLIDGAAIGGNVRYWTPRGHVDFGDALEGTATYDESLAIRQYVQTGNFVGFVVVATALSIIWNGVILLAVTLLVRRPFQRAGEHLGQHVWMDLGLGAAYFVVTPVAAVVLMVTVIGLPLGGLLMAGYVISLFLTKSLPGLVLAYWLANRSKQRWSIGKVFWVAFGLMAALQVIGLIPIIGWLVNLAALLVTFGAMLVAKYELFKKVA